MVTCYRLDRAHFQGCIADTYNPQPMAPCDIAQYILPSRLYISHTQYVVMDACNDT